MVSYGFISPYIVPLQYTPWYQATCESGADEGQTAGNSRTFRMFTAGYCMYGTGYNEEQSRYLGHLGCGVSKWLIITILYASYIQVGDQEKDLNEPLPIRGMSKCRVVDHLSHEHLTGFLGLHWGRVLTYIYIHTDITLNIYIYTYYNIHYIYKYMTLYNICIYMYIHTIWFEPTLCIVL